VDKCETR